MQALWLLIPILLIGGILFYVYKIQKPKKKKEAIDRLMNNLGYDVPFDWTQSDTTPYGCGVVWNGDPFGTPEAKELVFKCIDVGARNAFNAMKEKFPNWDFNPAFAVYAFLDGNYDSIDLPNTKIFKLKDNRTAAAFTIGTGDGYPMLLMILPIQKHINWANTVFTATVAWYEREHNMEYRSDSNEFLKGSGRADGFPDSHPHHLPAGFVPEPAPEPLQTVRTLVSYAQLSYEEMARKIKCGLSFPRFAPRGLKASTPIDAGLKPHDVVPKQIADRYVEAAKQITIAGK